VAVASPASSRTYSVSFDEENGTVTISVAGKGEGLPGLIVDAVFYAYLAHARGLPRVDFCTAWDKLGLHGRATDKFIDGNTVADEVLLMLGIPPAGAGAGAIAGKLTVQKDTITCGNVGPQMGCCWNTNNFPLLIPVDIGLIVSRQDILNALASALTGRKKEVENRLNSIIQYNKAVISANLKALGYKVKITPT